MDLLNILDSVLVAVLWCFCAVMLADLALHIWRARPRYIHLRLFMLMLAVVLFVLVIPVGTVGLLFFWELVGGKVPILF